MAKYRRSAKGASFRPEQVSGQGESRLQEYSDRIIGALREERDAVISNRNDISTAMKENADIESQQFSTNAKIEQKNVQTKLDSVQALNQASMQEFETKTKAQQQIFGTISKFSLTAHKKLQEIEIERLHEQWNNDYFQVLSLGDNDPNVKFVSGLIKDAQAKEVEGYTEINKGLENGLDKFDAVEASKRISSLSYGAKLALFQKVGQQYPSYLKEQFMDSTFQYTDDRDGTKFTGDQASRDPYRASIVAGRAMQSYLDISKLTGTNPALLQKSGLLNSLLSNNQSITKTARDANLQDTNFELDTSFNSRLANASSPEEAVAIIETSWIDLVNRKGLKGAHDYVTELVKSIDSDGNPIYNEQALFAAKLGPKGATWGDTWDKRREDIQTTIANGRDSAFRNEESRRQTNAIKQYRSIDEDLKAQLAAAGPSDDLDILGTAIKEFKDKYEGYVPPQLLVLQRDISTQNKAEAEANLQVAQQLAADGQLTQGQVFSIQDPTFRAQAQELLNTQNKASKFGNDYQQTLKALKSDAKTIAGDSLEGSASSSAVELQLFMEKQFAAWYKEGLAQNNGDPTAALAYARQNHNSELAKSKAGKEEGLYYRSVGENNATVYPNIQKERKRTEAVIDANKANITNTIGAVGMSALNSPGIIYREDALRNLSQTHYTGGSIANLITPEAKHAADLLGIGVMEVINRQINAYNKVNPNQINRIESPTIDLVNNARPETQKLFTDNPTPTSVLQGSVNITGSHRNYVRSSMGGDSIRQRTALVEVASELGVDPIDLATIIGFETGGTYDPGAIGGEGDNYQGLIQFGIPERAAYGVRPGMTFEEQLRGPVLRYFRDRFAGVGMSTQGATLEDLYTTVLAGNPKANRDARDSFGTSARSGVAKMGAHREAAMRRFGF